MPPNLLSGEISNPGGRKENQDASKIQNNVKGDQSLYQFIVADGLGGQGGGQRASQTAVHSILANSTIHKAGDIVGLDEYFAEEWLRLQFETAHDNIKKQQAKQPEFSRMATTLVVLMIMKDKAIWGHVGDSRLYMFRQGEIFHQTKDHSVPQMLVSSGEISLDGIRRHPDRNRLLRALGDHRESVQARVNNIETLQAGDVFLLCTDGFWEYVTEDQMLHSLTQANDPQHWIDFMSQSYLASAVENERIEEGTEQPENDNYTAIAVWFGNKPSFSIEELSNTSVESEQECQKNSWLFNLKRSLHRARKNWTNRISERIDEHISQPVEKTDIQPLKESLHITEKKIEENILIKKKKDPKLEEVLRNIHQSIYKSTDRKR